jgi:hypothetical protein
LPRLSEQSKRRSPFASVSSSIPDGKNDSRQRLEDESKMQRPVEAAHEVFNRPDNMMHLRG